MAGLIDGFISLMVNSVFGSSLLFAIFFLLFIALILFISSCSLEQIFIFLLIPTYYFFTGLLTGIAGSTIFALIVLINSVILYKNINKFIGV